MASLPRTGCVGGQRARIRSGTTADPDSGLEAALDDPGQSFWLPQLYAYLNFDPERSNRLTSTFFVEMQATGPIWAKTAGKNRGKLTSTFYHGRRFPRTSVRKSSSISLERGTGFEPAT